MAFVDTTLRRELPLVYSYISRFLCLPHVRLPARQAAVASEIGSRHELHRRRLPHFIVDEPNQGVVGESAEITACVQILSKPRVNVPALENYQPRNAPLFAPA